MFDDAIGLLSVLIKAKDAMNIPASQRK